jgi:formylmethanofuran dehydrogenase subunit E
MNGSSMSVEIKVKCIDNIGRPQLHLDEIYLATQDIRHKDNYLIYGISCRKNRFVGIEKETIYYNIWNIVHNRWSYNGWDATNREPKKLSLAEAERVCDDLVLGSDVFEIRPIIAIPKDQKCSKCSKPCPHSPPNQKDNTYVCVSCSTMLELERF